LQARFVNTVVVSTLRTRVTDLYVLMLTWSTY